MVQTWAYFDTSTYLKIFVKEFGSIQARELVEKYRVLSSAIVSVECFSALSRKKHAGELKTREFETLINKIRESLAHIEIIRLTDDVLAKAEQILAGSPIRSLDALHIASALIFQEAMRISLPFVTSDRRQLKTANEQGFKTVFVE
ncbi:MAG: type II toxin-antitoxin system VapC family toxin [Deltaproteobacteria bacterium]|nr:type II toxin-antitoxin system VapC family toxin [Deltaproteobacteria bacterium]